jgi:hypothetical protein
MTFERLGTLMQLTFADSTVERLCSTQELLVRAFGELWILVKFCLSLLEVAETLADLATFTALTISRTQQIGGDIADYLVGIEAIRLTVRALGPFASSTGLKPGHDGLAAIHAVSVMSVSQIPAAVARA